MADYCTEEEIRAQIQKYVLQAGDDTVFEAMITAASRAIDNFCNRPDGFVALSNATARVFPGSGGYVQLIDECVAITAVNTKTASTESTYANVWAAADWIPFSGDPLYPNYNSLPYDALMTTGGGDYPLFMNGRYGSLRGFRPDMEDGVSERNLPTVQITAKWGYAAVVPGPIKQACIIQVSRWFKRAQSAWADTLANGDFGMLMYQKSLDPTVKELLEYGRYVKPATGRR